MSFPGSKTEGLGYVSVDEPDLPGLVPPIARATSDIAYVRLHGRNKVNWWQPNSGMKEFAGPSKSARRGIRPLDDFGPLFAKDESAAEVTPRPWNPGDRYDYLYSEAELKEWVEKIRELSTKAKKTFVFFNNCHVGQAATGAKLMRRLLEGEGLL